MFAVGKDFANFAQGSYSWQFIERPALDRALPPELYEDSENVHILDIGCGTGRVIGYHVERGALEPNVTGVDADSFSAATSREYYPDAAIWHQKIQDTRLPSDTFRIATGILCLRYLDNDELAAAADSVVDSLTADGRFVMIDAHPDRYALDDGIGRYHDEGPRQTPVPWGKNQYEDYYYRLISTYERVFLDAGLRLIQWDDCPIAKTGQDDKYAKDYANYSRSAARFALTFAKI